VDQPFFSISGKMIKVHGEDVQVFQFANAAAADAEAAPISHDGMEVGTSKIHWIGSPHFFKKAQLLVLYVGGNPKVLKTLESLLGRQFAGK
jgi:folylpolyglutamate synthase/dihydropteroate synthase